MFLSVRAGNSVDEAGQDRKFPVADSVPAGEAGGAQRRSARRHSSEYGSHPSRSQLSSRQWRSLSPPAILLPHSGADKLSTNFGKAIMLGIYGADLGYLNMYGKTGNSIDVLTTIKTPGRRLPGWTILSTSRRLRRLSDQQQQP
ncbi:MAG: hypothetical protein MZV63_67570 [Marinilabiliales bacterium]|nr:hypothetical protein [Marinilabiliales bacterium]